MQPIGGIVAGGLRRWRLERLASMIDRLRRGEPVTAPRLYTIGPVVLLFAAAALAGLRAGETGLRLAEEAGFALNRAAAAAGLAISTVTVTGLKELEEWQVLEVLDIDETRSLLMFDGWRARAMLEALPWVQNAAVLKLYPGALRISIEERQPYALWQKDGKLFVIDGQGHVLEPYGKPRFASLPLVVGEGAAEAASSLFAALDAAPEVKARMKAAVRVGGRRWTLILHDGGEVKLPETGFEAAVAMLADLERETGLLERDIEAVDLRLRGRVTIRLTPTAAESRRAAAEARDGRPDKAGDT